jgi:3-oxoacyl-[acyl-carrier-protein] synthase I
MSKPLAIVGCGAVTPVGFSAAQTCAAIRAGISRFTLYGCRDRTRGPTLRAEVPLRPRPADAKPLGRLICMVSIAFRECLKSAGIHDPGRWPLLLGVREPFRASRRDDWSHAALLTALQRSLGITLHSRSRVFPTGNASAFEALAHARDLVYSEPIEGCLVGGVDSLLNAADMKTFGDAYRLKSDEVAQGFVPGEGAAFVAITRFGSSGRCAIRGLGITREEDDRTVLSDGYPTGKGLAAAIQAALEDSRIDEGEVAFRVSDMNGETYRGQESMLSLARSYRTRREHFPQILPAASIGELAAASGAVTMILAMTAIARGYAAGKIAICEASSDGGLRAACVIQGS